MKAISARVSFVLHHVDTDEQGRVIILSATIDSHPITLVNVYAPNTSQRKFYKMLRGKLDPYKNNALVMCFDFNGIPNPTLDSTNPDRHRASALSSFINN